MRVELRRQNEKVGEAAGKRRVAIKNERTFVRESSQRCATVNECRQRGGLAAENDVACSRTSFNMNAAAIHMCVIFVLAEPEADRKVEVPDAAPVDHRPERKQNRDTADWECRIVRGRARGPASKFLHDRFRLVSPFG